MMPYSGNAKSTLMIIHQGAFISHIFSSIKPGLPRAADVLLPGRLGLVQPADRHGQWRVVQRLRVALGGLCRLDHHLDEGVHGSLALGLGRLDHDRLLDRQREVDRGGVVATVDQELGDVDGVHAMDKLPGGGKDALVHADLVVGQLVPGLQPLLDVVGVEHRQFRGLDQPLATEHDDVSIGLGHHAEVPEEVGRAPDGMGIGGLLL